MPADAALAGREFLPYPDEILGKKMVFRTDDVLSKQRPYIAMFRKHWENAAVAQMR